jgi:hypothetical protein
MEQFQSLIMSASQPEEKRQDQNEEPSNEKAAASISENVFDHHLTKEEKSAAGEAMHYAMGGNVGNDPRRGKRGGARSCGRHRIAV